VYESANVEQISVEVQFLLDQLNRAAARNPKIFKASP
jgi:hypothetical protein